MWRLCTITAVTGACAFTGGSPSEPSAEEAGPDAGGPVVEHVCDAADPALRFCVDFEAPFASVIADLSANAADAIAGAVSTMNRGTARGAALSLWSSVHVSESLKLDIAQQLALDLWVRPFSGGHKAWLLDNNGQYAASLTDDGRARCVVKDKVVDSSPLPGDLGWHHVGCSYDGVTLKVFVDGQLASCSPQTIAIPTTGADGLALGANLAGTNAAPTYSERFIGGIDDVRVWARADVDMCAAAGATGCATSCPD